MCEAFALFPAGLQPASKLFILHVQSLLVPTWNTLLPGLWKFRGLPREFILGSKVLRNLGEFAWDCRL